MGNTQGKSGPKRAQKSMGFDSLALVQWRNNTCPNSGPKCQVYLLLKQKTCPACSNLLSTLEKVASNAMNASSMSASTESASDDDMINIHIKVIELDKEMSDFFKGRGITVDRVPFFLQFDQDGSFSQIDDQSLLIQNTLTNANEETARIYLY